MRLEKVSCMFEVHGSGVSRLYLQDALECLPNLVKEYSGKVQLIYIDPPFFTGREYYHSRFAGKTSTEAITDYSDKWESKEQLLSLLKSVLAGCRQLLSPQGSIYVHMDYRLGPYVRLIMDEIFGEQNFLNEIIWHYKSGGTAKKYFSRKHDTILFYRKSAKCYFDISPLGVSRGKERRNHLRHNVDSDGRVFWSIRSNGKEYRYYEDSPVYPSDVWDDIPHLQQKDRERTGYATQKPEKLLERIILVSSRPGDYVCDLFCGSGTTLVVANRNNRKFLGVDSSPVAFSVSRGRLLGADMLLHLQDCQEDPAIKLNVSVQDGCVEVLLCGYDTAVPQRGQRKTKQLGILDTRLGNEVSYGNASDNDTTAEYFAIGEILGDTFIIRDTTLWHRGGRLKMILAPQIGVTVGDITGKQYFFRLYPGD